jgi:hypothetical protein
MFGYKDDEVENKNKIEQLEEQMEMLENKIANIMDVLEIQEEDVDDDMDEDVEDDRRRTKSKIKTPTAGKC